MEKHPLHLKNPELQTSPEVKRAVLHEERKSGEKVPNDPAERIEAYVDRLENIFLNPDERVRERNLEMFREKIYDKLIIKREHFPESYFELQQRIARERGQAVEEIPENIREQMMDVAIEDQKASLDAWMDYLTSDDAVYPAWFKYYVWTQATKLSQFDKERREFKKRTSSTVAPFPDIYREPLAQIADIYEKVKDNNKNLKEPDIREMFSKKFPTLYAELTQKSLASSMESREEIRGEWIKYQKGKGGEAEKLFQSLEGKGTGWCTAGRLTAEVQVQSGDFYVYYTNDSSGKPTQPRLAIRMNANNKISEVRGILPHQNIEPQMQEVLDKKLQDFGSEADTYRKKSDDMKMLTALEHKQKKGEPFTKADLSFLYELNDTIEGFGYSRDPRIAELRADRNIREDLIALFEDKKKERIEIGGKTADQLIDALKQAGVSISDYAKILLNCRDFVPNKNLEETTFIHLTVTDLGFKKNPSSNQIYAQVRSLGFDLCPADTAPHYLLKHLLPLESNEFIGMEILRPQWPNNNTPGIFLIGSGYRGHGVLDATYLTSEQHTFYLDSKFIFSLPKATSDLTFPQVFDGDLKLYNLTSAKDLKLPRVINGSLNLNGLVSAKYLILPQAINGNLHLRNLTSAKELTLPQVSGRVDLSGITSAERQKLQEKDPSLKFF